MEVKVIGKTDSGKYKVKLGDRIFTTYDDVLIKNGVIYKKEIDENILNQITKDHEYYDAYNKTISYILKHQRCTFEINKYLESFDISDESKTNIINHLKSIGLLNDTIYTKSYISDSINLTKDGPQKIKNKLLGLKIDENIIDEELSKMDNDIITDKALKIITKKIKTNHKYSEYQLKQKILMEMINLGYDKEFILNLIDNFSYQDNELLEKEFNKLYMKLSKKYTGYELIAKIKQKLYSKGFDINMINDLIQNIEV